MARNFRTPERRFPTGSSELIPPNGYPTRVQILELYLSVQSAQQFRRSNGSGQCSARIRGKSSIGVLPSRFRRISVSLSVKKRESGEMFACWATNARYFSFQYGQAAFTAASA